MPSRNIFADGIAEDIITALSQNRVAVRHRPQLAFTYKGKSVDIRQVGRELGVRYVLEGSVRKAGNRVRITGQLIEAATGTHLWAERYDRALEDIFAVQDEITHASWAPSRRASWPPKSSVRKVRRRPNSANGSA